MLIKVVRNSVQSVKKVFGFKEPLYFCGRLLFGSLKPFGRVRFCNKISVDVEGLLK
jgi:hypothetical protein